MTGLTDTTTTAVGVTPGIGGVVLPGSLSPYRAWPGQVTEMARD